jgi:hypothetical protein
MGSIWAHFKSLVRRLTQLSLMEIIGVILLVLKVSDRGWCTEKHENKNSTQNKHRIQNVFLTAYVA